MARKPKLRPQCPNCKHYQFYEFAAVWLILAIGFDIFLLLASLILTFLSPIVWIFTLPIGILAIVAAVRVKGWRCLFCGWVGKNPIMVEPE